MKIHYFQHVPFEGLGCIEDWARTTGHRLSSTRFFANDPLPEIETIDWLVIMGGPMGAGDEGKYPWLTPEKQFIEKVIEVGKVVLGVCLGAQLIADVLGSRVYPNQHKEIGWFPLELTEAGQRSTQLGFLPAKFNVFHWHGDTFDLPVGAVHLAHSEACRNQAFMYTERVLGLQFHLELSPDNVKELIKNCSAEIVEGKFIQNRSQLFDPREGFEWSNMAIKEVLDRMQKVGT
ncbi:MAG: type 1 glutamine amidotransferase [Terriglobia bacterium]